MTVFKRLILPEMKSIIYGVIGEPGAATFTLRQVWAEPTEQMPEILQEDCVLLDNGWYMGIDLGQHWRALPADREWLSPMDPCPILDMGTCWYDGSGLGGLELMNTWKKAKLDDKVIKAVLEAYYAGVFGDADG